MKTIILAILALALPVAEVSASGGYAFVQQQQVLQQRISIRQRIQRPRIQRVRIKQQLVQPVYAAPLVQQVYAAPIVQQVRVKQFVAAPVYAAPIVVQPYIQQQQVCPNGVCPLQQLQQYTPALPQCQ